MRQAGQLSSREQALALFAHLRAARIDGRVEDDDDGGAIIWVYDDARLDDARQMLSEFVADPTAPRWHGEATARRGEAEASDPTEPDQAESRPDPNLIDVRKRWQGTALGGHLPVTFTLIALSVAVALASSFGQDQSSVISYLFMAPFTQGQIWRLVTPIFIHLSLLHLAFNMIWLLDLGGQIERQRGRWPYAVLVVAIAVPSNLLQYSLSGPSFGGMSGVVYGLFAYTFVHARWVAGSNLVMSRNTTLWLMGWMVLCLAMPGLGVANGAHFGGLLAGAAYGSLALVRRQLGR